MYCFTIALNGEPLCAAGCADASFLDVMVSGSVFEDAPASLRVAGMQELPNDRMAHVYWMDEFPLHAGDTVVITPRDRPEPTAPVSVVPTDSPEYIAEQDGYQDFLKAHIWPQPALVPRRRTVVLKLTHPKVGLLHAAIPVGQQHMLCTVLWNNRSTRPARVFARSFSEDNRLEWLREELQQDESLTVQVGI